MTPSQLRQWSFQNSQPDQWWLNLDGVTEEIPVTVAEIEERLKSGHYSAFQVLHVSQAGMENAPWVEVAMPPVMNARLAMRPLHGAVAPAPSTASPVSATGKTQKPQEKTSKGCFILVWTAIIGIIISYLVYESHSVKVRKAKAEILKQEEIIKALDKSIREHAPSQGSVRATGIALTLEKRKALYRDAILSEREAKKQAAILFPMPDVNSKEYRESGVALSIMTKQNEEEERIKKELWKNLVRDYDITEDALIEIIVEGSSGKWPKP